MRGSATPALLPKESPMDGGWTMRKSHTRCWRKQGRLACVASAFTKGFRWGRKNNTTTREISFKQQRIFLISTFWSITRASKALRRLKTLLNERAVFHGQANFVA